MPWLMPPRLKLPARIMIRFCAGRLDLGFDLLLGPGAHGIQGDHGGDNR